MAAQIKTLTFSSRQEIPFCTLVAIHFDAGDWLCEYVPASEVQLQNGAWQYQFYVQESGAPGSMTLADFQNCNVETSVPYFHCAGHNEEEADPEDCPARALNCFNAIDVIEGIENGLYLALLEYDEVCDKFCLRAYPAEDFLPEATPERHAMDYEVFGPTEPLQANMETYITHWPRPMAPVDGLRVSVAQFGAGSLVVNFTVNGNNLTTAPVTLPPGTRTLAIAAGSLNPLYQSGNSIPIGAEVLAEVVSASYDEYGTNWEGLRLAFLGRFTA